MIRTAQEARRTTWIALPLGLALVGALTLSPALAQGAARGDAATGMADGPPRTAGAFMMRHGHDGAFAMRGMRFDPRAGGPRGAMAERLGDAAMQRSARFGADGADPRADAFARWLGADADHGPIVPGLVGPLADGTSVRLAFYDAAPADGGTELASLTFVTGEGDVAAFRDSVRETAEGATHVVVDVLGRVVALPETAPTDAAE